MKVLTVAHLNKFASSMDSQVFGVDAGDGTITIQSTTLNNTTTSNAGYSNLIIWNFGSKISPASSDYNCIQLQLHQPKNSIKYNSNCIHYSGYNCIQPLQLYTTPTPPTTELK